MRTACANAEAGHAEVRLLTVQPKISHRGHLYHVADAVWRRHDSLAFVTIGNSWCLRPDLASLLQK